MTATEVREPTASAATHDVTSPVVDGSRRAWWESAVLPVLLVVALGAVVAWRTSFVFEGTRTFTLFDDAMVSMRYAHNLATGHGLVYNSGEHVEGYTNFLWTLWMAFLHLLPIPRAQLSAWVAASGLACVAVTVVLAGRIGARLVPTRPEVRVFTMWAVALWYPLIFWSVRGLEPGFLAALVAGAVLLALRIDDDGPTRATAIGLGALLVAGLLTRTDFMILAVVLLIWLARKPGPARTTAAVVAGVLVFVLAAHTAARLDYYGDALPNTYTLKLKGTGLGERVARGVLAFGSVVLAELAIVIALAAVAVWWLRDPRAVLLASLFGAAAAYSVYVGGDAWEYNQYDNRYLATVVPLLLVLAAAGVVSVARSLRHSARWGIALGLFAVVVTVVDVALPTDEAGLRVWWNISELRLDHWMALAAFVALGAAALLAARRKARPVVVATGARTRRRALCDDLTVGELVAYDRRPGGGARSGSAPRDAAGGDRAPGRNDRNRVGRQPAVLVRPADGGSARQGGPSHRERTAAPGGLRPRPQQVGLRLQHLQAAARPRGRALAADRRGPAHDRAVRLPPGRGQLVRARRSAGLPDAAAAPGDLVHILSGQAGSRSDAISRRGPWPAAWPTRSRPCRSGRAGPCPRRTRGAGA